MASGLETIIYPVKDLAAAKQLFGTAFGVPPYIDEPYYVAFNVGGQDVGLDPNGHGDRDDELIGRVRRVLERRRMSRSLECHEVLRRARHPVRVATTRITVSMDDQERDRGEFVCAVIREKNPSHHQSGVDAVV